MCPTESKSLSETRKQYRLRSTRHTYVAQNSKFPRLLKQVHTMPEPHFDIDRLGMLTLQHFESGVESDSSSSCSHSEHGSNTSSPPYFKEEFESPLSSPTELGPPVDTDTLWETNEAKTFVDCPEDVREEHWSQQPTCRYRRGRRGKEIVSKRNERERRRVRLISEGFCALRKCLMIQPCIRKLPKLQILRKAIRYIKNLEDMIRESDQNGSPENRLSLHPGTQPQIQMSYIFKPSYNKPARAMPTNYADTPSFRRRHDVSMYHHDPHCENPWLRSYKL